MAPMVTFRTSLPIANQSQTTDGGKPVDLTPDFFGENRHEFVAKLAYQHWERRGMPLGSPEVDWFAAERAVYESLAASRLVSPFANPQDIKNQIYG